MENRKIIHIDMDAFYASVEQLDYPEYRGKPIAVGGNAERGVVAAASYEARKFGVKSAMSSRMAAKRCPELIFVKPRFDRYQEISTQIRSIFERYTDQIEPLSLDEAFLDVSQNHQGQSSATFIAQSIKNDIKNELGLIASAGVSYNKFLAKMASDEDKPDGLYVIEPKDALSYVATLPIDRFFGIGKVTADKMKSLGVVNGKQLRALSLDFLCTQFGKAGKFFYHIARAEDQRPVQVSRERKSIAVERTLETNIDAAEDLSILAHKLAENLWKRYDKNENRAKTISLKLKFADFTISTKAETYENGLNNQQEMLKACLRLVDLVLPLSMEIRLMGFQVSNFITEDTKKDRMRQTQLDFDNKQ